MATPPPATPPPPSSPLLAAAAAAKAKASAAAGDDSLFAALAEDVDGPDKMLVKETDGALVAELLAQLRAKEAALDADAWMFEGPRHAATVPAAPAHRKAFPPPT